VYHNEDKLIRDKIFVLPKTLIQSSKKSQRQLLLISSVYTVQNILIPNLSLDIRFYIKNENPLLKF